MTTDAREALVARLREIAIGADNRPEGLPNGITGIVRHRLAG